MRTKKPRRPRDTNQLAKLVVDIATGERRESDEIGSQAAQSPESKLGRIGGLKGGPARAKTLTPEQRREIARKAAIARWRRDGSDKS